jgi:hypothetical protein
METFKDLKNGQKEGIYYLLKNYTGPLKMDLQQKNFMKKLITRVLLVST